MTMVLYGRPFSGSLAVEFLLEELVLPYERALVMGYRDAIRPASYAAINPLRQVPALRLDDGTLMTESGAIMLHLAERHGGALAPGPEHPDRARYLRWMVYLAATVYPTAMTWFHPENYIEEESRFEAIRDRGRRWLVGQWAVLDEALGASGYLAGNAATAADYYFLMFAIWFDDLKDVGDRPNTARLRRELMDRAAVQRVMARTASADAWAA